jgi:hypothetical protein
MGISWLGNRRLVAAAGIFLALSSTMPIAPGVCLDEPARVLANAAEAGRLLDDSNRLRPRNRMECLRLLLAAETVMPPFYSRKNEVLDGIITVEEELSRISDLQRLDEKLREHYSADALVRRKALLAGTKPDSPEQMNAFAALAGRDLQLGLLDDADKNFRQALRLGWRKSFFRQYTPWPDENRLVAALVKAGRVKQAESLLLFIEEQYLTRENTACAFGESNPFIAELRAERFAFYADQKRFDDADALLNDILGAKFADANYELARYYLYKKLNATFETLAKSEDSTARQNAIAWAQKLLTVQLSHYASDDYRVADTRLSLAFLAEQCSNWPVAVDNYASALSIGQLYGPESEQVTRAREGLKRIDLVIASTPTAEPGLSASIDKTLTQAKHNAVELRMLSEKPMDGASEAESHAHYQSLEKLAPYCVWTSNCFYQLSTLYEKSESWSAIPPLVAATVQYQRHTSPDLPVGCCQGNSWSYTNRGLILLAVKALLKIGTQADATSFLNTQMQVLKEEFGFDDYVSAAQAATLIGDIDLSLKLWGEVIDHASSESDAIHLERVALPALVQLKAQALEERAKQVAARINKSYDQKREAQTIATDAEAKKGFYPAKVSTDPYAFNYAALASRALTIGPDARLLLYDGPGQPWWYSDAGSFGTFTTTEPLLQSGQMKFVYHGGPRTFGPPAKLVSTSDFDTKLVGTKFFYGPPAVPKLPFTPPPAVPKSALRLNVLSDFQILKPGDYVSKGGAASHLDMMEKGRVRLFITGDTTLSSDLTIAAEGQINPSRGDRPFDERGDFILPYEFEIWYGGKKPIRLEKGATYNGAIYAPESAVVLEDGAQIHGAVIARTITLNGRSAIYFVRRH